MPPQARSLKEQHGNAAKRRNRAAQLERVASAGKLAKSVSVLAVAEKLWSILDTPVSLGLSLLAKAGQLEDVLAKSFQPERYLEKDLELARDDYQAIAFLKKCPLEVAGVDREASAFKKFIEAEELCRETNARFRSYRQNATVCPPHVEGVLQGAKRKISDWLGGPPSALSWALRCRFGPGADVRNTGSHAQAYHKLSRMSVTADFYEGAHALVLSTPGWYRNSTLLVSPSGEVRCGLETVPGNKVTFVPKTALTDRSIAIEPGMNIYAQLGLGALLRSRLKRVGLDLDNADPNRGLARQGSRDGTVATIDLSMASDTVAREVVRELIPEPWYVALDWVRSKTGSYTPKGSRDSVMFRYEKFSSMGNGFTFELESMIFYALALACTEVSRERTSLVRAYGDDITVPTGVVPLLAEVLSFCGFKMNPNKSYFSGLFRESCGMDFFNGVNTRPFFLEEDSLGRVESLYRLANGIRRAAYRRNLGFGCDGRLRPLWVHLVRRLPSAFRDLKSPPIRLTWRDERLADLLEVAEVDGALMSSWHEAQSSPLVVPNRDYQRGWLFCTYKGRSRSFKATSFAGLKRYALYRARDGEVPETATWDNIPLRGEGKPRLSWGLFTPSWDDSLNWF